MYHTDSTIQYTNVSLQHLTTQIHIFLLHIKSINKIKISKIKHVYTQNIKNKKKPNQTERRKHFSQQQQQHEQQQNIQICLWEKKIHLRKEKNEGKLG